MGSSSDTRWVIAHAKALGFDLCGVAPAPAPAPAQSLENGARRDEWLARGYAGQMRYLHDPRRADPTLVLPDAKCVIVCAINYNAPLPLSTHAAASAGAANQAHGWISRYAWGDDYHRAIGEKLKKLVAALTDRFGDTSCSLAYVDTGPVSERTAAQQAGLGWLAKNTCLINEDIGSWLFLGVIVTSLDLAYSTPVVQPAADLCGNCRLCIDACPTDALVEPYVMDARRCISYLTIELRESIPEDLRGAMGWQVFGCDICQDVCPWNRSAPTTTEATFAPREKLFAPELLWLLSIGEAEFSLLFRHSALKRTKWRGLIRNACVAAGNASAPPAPRGEAFTRLRERLSQLASSTDAMIAEHAAWALARMDANAQ